MLVLKHLLYCLSSIVPNPCKNVCSHLCLLRPGGYTCACPQGSSQTDATECDAGKRQLQLSPSPSARTKPTVIWLCIHETPPVHVLVCSCAVLWFEFVGIDGLCAWLLLLQPLNLLFQCPLHADAWMVEPAILMMVICPCASECRVAGAIFLRQENESVSLKTSFMFFKENS